LSSWTWLISQMQRGQVRKASVTGPPTGSSSGGLMTGMPMAWQGTPL
jgi:hypothetical protein